MVWYIRGHVCCGIDMIYSVANVLLWFEYIKGGFNGGHVWYGTYDTV